jgi:hypothetical protein
MKRVTAVLLLTAGLMLLPVASHVNSLPSYGLTIADGGGPAPPPQGPNNLLSSPTSSMFQA